MFKGCIQRETARRIGLFLALTCTTLLSACNNLGSGSDADQIPFGRNFSSANTTISSSGGEVGIAIPVTVKLNDQNGYGFQGIVPQFTAVDGSGLSTAVISTSCPATDATGTAVCSIVVNTPVTLTLKLTYPLTITGTSITFIQIARTLQFVQQPSCGGSTCPSTLATPLSTQPTVQVIDSAGNIVLTNSGTVVTLALVQLVTTSTSTSATGGSLVATTASGVATFTTVAVSGTIGAYELTASATGLTSATSSQFTLTYGPASKIAVTTQPSTATPANVAFAQQPVFSIEDSAGNVVTNTTCTITTTANGLNSDDSYLGTLSKTAINGVVDFTGLNLRISTSVGGSAYTITGSGSGSCASLTSATTSAFSITLSGVPAQIAIVTQPSEGSVNQIWTTQPIIEVLDLNGNLVSTDNTTVVVVSVASTTASVSGNLTGSTAIQVVNGIATFADLEMQGATQTSADVNNAGIYTLQFNATNSSVPSLSANVTVTEVIDSFGLVPAKLKFSQQPTNTSVKGIISPSVTVQVVDSNGHLCANDNTSEVFIALNAYPTACTSGNCLEGTGRAVSGVPITVVNGVATFFDLDSTVQGGGFQLIATDGGGTGLTSATSTFFAVAAYGAANQLAFTTQPVAVSGDYTQTFTTQPVVAVKDINNNTVASNSGTQITLSCTATTGTCTLAGNVTENTINGVATFTNLHVNPAPSGPITLHASSNPAFINTDSNTF